MTDNFQIDSLDRKILSMITQNARVPFLEVARKCGVSGAAIHQRIQRLADAGVISGSEFIVSPLKLGLKTCAYIGIFLEKASLYDEVVAQIESIPEVVECHYITGEYAIFIKVYARDNEHLRNVINVGIQSIKGIFRTETFISLEERFRRQLFIPEGDD